MRFKKNRESGWAASSRLFDTWDNITDADVRQDFGLQFHEYW